MKAPYIYKLNVALVCDISEDILNEAKENVETVLPGYRKFFKRIAHKGNRLSIDVCMPLSDGRGMMSILLSLAAEYIRLRFGSDVRYCRWVPDPFCIPDPDEDNFNGFTGKIFLKHGFLKRKKASRDNIGHIELPSGMERYISSIVCG